MNEGREHLQRQAVALEDGKMHEKHNYIPSIQSFHKPCRKQKPQLGARALVADDSTKQVSDATISRAGGSKPLFSIPTTIASHLPTYPG